MMKQNNLFKDFSPITLKTWKEKVTEDLKGADYQKKLVWKTDEGFNTEPYYTGEELDALLKKRGDETGLPLIQKKSNDWKIRTEFPPESSFKALNQALLHAIDRGVTSAGIDLIKKAPETIKDLEILLQGIAPGQLEINFKHTPDPVKLVSLLQEYLQQQQQPHNVLQGSLGFDPVAMLTAKGTFDEASFDDLEKALKNYAAELSGFRMIHVNPGLIQDGGGTLSQELGFGLAMANAYLGRLSESGIDPSLLANTLMFSFAAGPDYFMEIAKLRAARYLWDAVCNEYGIENQPSTYIHSRTAAWNLTIYDPNVNMLRTTTESMSASLGGSDSITVHPFDKMFREPNEFTSRIARNTQIVLKEEAGFHKVTDPAAGSYYIEKLTDQIAEQGWELFVQTEKQGGYIEAFKKGWIQEQVNASAERKTEKASSGRLHILGVNQYPNSGETLLSQENLAFPAEADHHSDYVPIKLFRVAASLEKLRMETEKSKNRPKVYLLKYGDPKWSAARAMFAANFFATAGYEIINPSPFISLDQSILEAKTAKAGIIVFCSSDETYAEMTPQIVIATGLKAELVIAGYPKESVDTLKEMGILHFIHVKSNLLEELRKFNALMGIKAE